MSKLIDKFFKTLDAQFDRRNKMRVLYGIIAEMSQDELRQVQEGRLTRRRQRIEKLTELDAPASIIENEKKALDELISGKDSLSKFIGKQLTP